jgi:hypothetical protein
MTNDRLLYEGLLWHGHCEVSQSVSQSVLTTPKNFSLSLLLSKRLSFLFALLISLTLIVGCGGGGGGGTTTTSGGTTTAPSAPTGVTAATGDGQVTISWSAVSGATSYNIYMASQSGVTKSNYSTLTNGMKHEGVTSPYTHTSLTNGTIYYFVVTAVNSAGESSESSQVSATPSLFTGTWKTTINGTLFQESDWAGHTTTMTLIIIQSGTNLSVTWSFTDTKGRSGTQTITGSGVSGNSFSGQTTDTASACASRTVTSTFTVSGNTITESGSAPAAGSCSAVTYTFTYTKQ